MPNTIVVRWRELVDVEMECTSRGIAVLETRPKCSPKCSDQDEDQDRHWSETGLVVRPRSQTTTLIRILTIYIVESIVELYNSRAAVYISWSVSRLYRRSWLEHMAYMYIRTSAANASSTLSAV